MEIQNHDIVALVNRLDRYVEELQGSVSAGTNDITEADLKRIHSYLNELIRLHSWVVSRPQLDLPKSHPTAYTIADAPANKDVESEFMQDLLRILFAVRIEVTESDSARRACGMSDHDSGRLLSIIDKAKAFLDDYATVVAPLDLPESSPRAQLSGPGRKISTLAKV